MNRRKFVKTAAGLLIPAALAAQAEAAGAFGVRRPAVISGSPGGSSTNFANMLFYTNFSGGSLGATPGGVEWANPTVYDNSFVEAPATTSARQTCAIASENMGYVYALWPTNSPRRFDTLWQSFRWRPRSGSSFTANPWLKFMRAHIKTINDDSGSGNVGYNDIYRENTGKFHFVFEGENVNEDFAGGSTAYDFTNAAWQTYDMSIVFDTVPVDSGGQARIRFWKDKTLIGQITDRPTMSGTSDYCTDIRFCSYWNATGYPQSQVILEIQGVAVGIKKASLSRDDSTSMTTDSNGYPLIALGF